MASSHPEDAVAGGGQVIDLMAALQASLGKPKGAAKTPAKAAAAATNVTELSEAKTRKGVKRVTKAIEPVAAPAPVRARAKK